MNYKLSLSPLLVLELIGSIFFIIFFGFGNFLFFILFSTIFGVLLLGIFWKNMLDFELYTLKHMLTQFSFVLAGFLFIFPGIITSFLASFVLIFGIFLKLIAQSKHKRAYKRYQSTSEEIIDVEIIEDKK